MFSNFSWQSCRLWGTVEKYGTARHPADDNEVRRMRFACFNNEGHMHTHTRDT